MFLNLKIIWKQIFIPLIVCRHYMVDLMMIQSDLLSKCNLVIKKATTTENNKWTSFFFLSWSASLTFFRILMTMLAGYTPDTISSIIDSLCSNLERTHAWKSQWQFHMYTESYRLFAHWHSFFSFSKNVSKKWKFLIYHYMFWITNFCRISFSNLYNTYT